MELYVTANRQKDGRVLLGTVAHVYKDCSHLGDRKPYRFSGTLISVFSSHLCKLCKSRRSRNLRKLTKEAWP